MTDTEFWIETVKRALGGDKAAQWEIQQFVAMQTDKRHNTALLIDHETGETAYRHSERNVDLPAPIVTYLATLCAMVTDGEMDPRAALLSNPPKEKIGERVSEMALRVRWYVRKHGYSVENASDIVAREYGMITQERVRRIAKGAEKRTLADALLDWYDENNRAVPFPILHNNPFG